TKPTQKARPGSRRGREPGTVPRGEVLTAATRRSPRPNRVPRGGYPPNRPEPEPSGGSTEGLPLSGQVADTIRWLICGSKESKMLQSLSEPHSPHWEAPVWKSLAAMNFSPMNNVLLSPSVLSAKVTL